MIFCGDFAYPFCKYDKENFNSLPESFVLSPKIINFESTLDSLNKDRKTRGIAISSSDNSLNYMVDLGVVGVTLSNNHVNDYCYDINKFLLRFDENNIEYTGLGSDIDSASKPIMFGEYVVLNFGWETIGCKAVKGSRFGCNPLDYRHVKVVVTHYTQKFPEKKIIVVFHWNYEFEQYPQPAHRVLAKELIDIGVESIIGHHSHIIQGAEIYKGKAIIYGLGNFYLPKFNYAGYYLDFPDKAYIGLAVDIKKLDSYLVYSHNNELKISEPIPLFENKEVMKVSQFGGMNDSEYYEFFKLNRVKRKLLLIYSSWGWKEYANDKYVYIRQVFIDLLVRFNLKSHKK